MEIYGEIYCKHCGKLISEGDTIIIFEDRCFDTEDCLWKWVKNNTEYMIYHQEDDGYLF